MGCACKPAPWPASVPVCLVMFMPADKSIAMPKVTRGIQRPWLVTLAEAEQRAWLRSPARCEALELCLAPCLLSIDCLPSIVLEIPLSLFRNIKK